MKIHQPQNIAGLPTIKEQTIIGTLYLSYANKLFARLRGLLGTEHLSKLHGLVLSPCNSVHSFGMKYSIALICLNKEGVIVGIKPCLKPNRIFFAPKGTYAIAELPVDTDGICYALIGCCFYQIKGR